MKYSVDYNGFFDYGKQHKGEENEQQRIWN